MPVGYRLMGNDIILFATFSSEEISSIHKQIFWSTPENFRNRQFQEQLMTLKIQIGLNFYRNYRSGKKVWSSKFSERISYYHEKAGVVSGLKFLDQKKL